MHNNNKFEISAYSTKYQEEIDAMMSGIQQEFDELFTSPSSKTIAALTELGDIYWVGLYDNKVAGTIGLSRFDDKTAVIKRMFVAKEYRGGQMGVAQKLMHKAIDEAARLGVNDVYLGTMKQFEAAQKFYAKNHFIGIPKSDLPAGMILNELDTLFFRYRLK